MNENTGDTLNKHPAETDVDYLEMFFILLLLMSKQSITMSAGCVLSVSPAFSIIVSLVIHHINLLYSFSS